MLPLTFRTAREGDLDRLLEIHTSAFPDPRGVEARWRNFSANPLGPLDTLHLALRAETIIAHAFLFRFEVGFGGARVQAGAVASVGVAPEARGEGVASALLAHLHAESEARRDAITILYPFRQSFYARHGYAPVTPTRRLSLHPAAIPNAWRAIDPSLTIRVAAGPDRDAISLCYARAAALTTGWLVRPEALWARILQDERRVWLVASRESQIEGYVSWTLDQSEPHAATRLVVHEVVAADDVVRRALLGRVGAQRDQIADITLEIDAHDPLDRALLDADRSRFGTREVEHAIGVVAGGPMVRITDVARACEGRGYPIDGAIDLVVDDAAPFTLDVKNGKCTIHASRAAPQLRLDRKTLGAVLYGALPPSHAARLGWLTADAHTLSLADALLGLPPYFALDTF